ncbi:MAG: DRTGG domain-containing protein [Smithellaceae bacterium]|nr:DRTGG domain-containing protein [Smithellaceae bacterium]
MNRLVVASMRENAGKTSIIIGIGKALQKRIGYIKPFGERLLYRKKRLWDYDAALIANIFGLDVSPEEMSIGFHHSKLFYMLDEAQTRERVIELATGVEKEKDVLFIEAGKDITYGLSVHLDALSLSRYLEAQMLFVISGDEETILDDATFLSVLVREEKLNIEGLIINKIDNKTDFEDIYLPRIQQLGLKILGTIPYQRDLSYFSVGFLADRLFARVVAGDAGVGRTAKSIYIGSMSSSAAMKDPLFQQESKLVITDGDRTDMIAAALSSNTAAVIVTNNILPPAALIARAEEAQIPLLSVSADTYQVAKQIDTMEPLPTKNDEDKIAIITSMIADHVDIKSLDF